MTQNHSITDEKLNALLDRELDNDERAFVLGIMQQDTDVAARYCALRRVKESVSTAYTNPPLPEFTAQENRAWEVSRSKLAFASCALLLIGIFAGWIGGMKMSKSTPDMLSLAQFRSVPLSTDRVVIHINSMSEERVNSVLDVAEQVLIESEELGKPLRLEVIANEEALNLLRIGSPYSGNIELLTGQYKNVSFLACGIARKVAALKEHQEITLLPQAQQVPAALEQILNRIEQGWTYVKG